MDTKAKAAVSAERGAGGRRILTRFRLAALAVLAALLAIGGVSVWRARSLDGLPDVGDPFDVAQARRAVEVPDEDNAFLKYKEARGLLTRYPAALRNVDWPKVTWSNAGKEAQTYVEQNRPALEVWRLGTERPDAMYHQPGELAIDTILPVTQDLRTLGRLANLEGSRLEEQGEMEAAWGWYKAALRASRHVGRRGLLIERWFGCANFKDAADRIVHWAADPRVSTPLLRQALADATAADKLTVPLAVSLKLDYLIYMRDLDELRVTVADIPMPGGRTGLLEKIATATGAKAHVQRMRVRATNDVERSRRVLRLLYANWLPQVDKPAKERAPVAVHKPTVIYAADPNVPSSARAIAPEDLDRAIGQTLLAEEFFRPDWNSSWSGWDWEAKGSPIHEPRWRAALIVKLAAEVYRREQGKPPANAGMLVDAYLKELPAGVKPDDAIPAEIDAKP
jgi:hypothetical protein